MGSREHLRCDMYECSECKNIYTDLSGEMRGMNFCPNCGVDMRSNNNLSLSDIDECVKIMETERECVKRQGTDKCPDRNCGKCDLLLPTQDVLWGYDTVLRALKDLGDRIKNA